MEKTNSATESLFHLPGWYWYLEDEKDFQELPNAENFLEICLRVISNEFRMKGYHELFKSISKTLPIVRIMNHILNIFIIDIYLFKSFQNLFLLQVFMILYH